MRPDDPDFPEDIPPIPDPYPPADNPGETSLNGYSAESESGQTPAPSPEAPSPEAPSPDSEAPDANWARAEWDEDSEEWNEADSDLAPDSPPYPTSSATDAASAAGSAPIAGRLEATPSANRGGSGGEVSRVAETPAAGSEYSDDWAREEVPYQPKELGPIDQLLLLLSDGVTQWKRLLRRLRSLLPPNLQRQLPDQVLTAIILGVLVLLLAIWKPLGSPSTTAQPSASPQSPAATATEAPPASPTVTPGEPASGTAAPAPTPEQSLISDIQTQLASISQASGASLIESIDVNLARNQLVVNIDATWYGLPASQQNTLAQDIYTQVQSLQFKTLHLLAPDGQLLARNPVVGNTMVILHRSRPAEDLLASP